MYGQMSLIYRFHIPITYPGSPDNQKCFFESKIRMQAVDEVEYMLGNAMFTLYLIWCLGSTLQY